MKIIFFITTLIFAQTSLADSLAYFETVTRKQGPEALMLHQETAKTSKKLQILNCPIALIERQWEGLVSIIEGISYLQEYINISDQEHPDYKSIDERCRVALEKFKHHDRTGLYKARALKVAEIEVLKSILTKSIIPNSLINVIINAINQETLCYTNRVSAIIAAGVGVSAGSYKMECYTPLGRRFKLRGPSVGVAAGAGIAVSLPNHGFINKSLSYRFMLFMRSERDPWAMVSTSKGFASIFGLNAQHDKHKDEPALNKSMVYDYDLNATVGGGLFVEKSYQIMSKKNLSPLYIKFVQTQLFDTMAEKI